MQSKSPWEPSPQQQRPPGSLPPPPYLPSQPSQTQTRRFPTLPPPYPVSIPAPAPAPAPEEAPTRWGAPEWALVAAIVIGAAAAMVTIPTWLPILGASIVGSDVKAYWYLSRASGLTAFALLWVSMVSGLIITNKMARIWPGAFTAFDLHQFTSLLGLGFGVFHIVVLLGNRYVPYDVASLLVPFASSAYRPIWVGIGQIAFYLLLLVTFTFYVRRQIGNRLWHGIHYLSYLVFVMILLHGLLSGTDSTNPWVAWMYWLSAATLAALTLHRMSAKQTGPVRQTRKT